MIVVDPIREYPPSMTTDKGLPARHWCHMTSDIAGDDGRRELLEFAQRIGCRPDWRQHWDEWSFHFDLTRLMRMRAVQAGAVEVEARDFWQKRYLSAAGEAVAKREGLHPKRPVFGVTQPPHSPRGCPEGGGRSLR